MKALTVRQPWPWAILRAGKDVENRSTAWTHRGPLAIHAAGSFSGPAFDDDTLLRHAVHHSRRGDLQARAILNGAPTGALSLAHFALARSAVVGVVDVIDAHRSAECDCTSEWAQAHARVHLVLANPRPLVAPVDCSGTQGLWTLPADVEERVLAQVAV